MELFSNDEFNNVKFRDLLTVQCDVCNKIFYQEKRTIYNRRKFKNSFIVCSKYCACYKNRTDNGLMPPKKVTCKNCNNIFMKGVSEIKKTNNNFCSPSCSAIYNNSHKTKGNRRSRLEIWLEEQLTLLYPDLDIWYSDKTTINSELDIYTPSLNLAFELNGIFHYEPIFGKFKLDQIQNNDHRKFQACLEKDIELCIINTSSQKYFKPSTSQKYLDIITKLVNMKLSKTDCVEVL